MFCLFSEKVSKSNNHKDSNMVGINRWAQRASRFCWLNLVMLRPPLECVAHGQQECLHLVRECVEVTDCPCNSCHHVCPCSPFLDECFRQSPFNSRSKSSSPAEASSSTRAAFHGRMLAEVLPHSRLKENAETHCKIFAGAVALALLSCAFSCVTALLLLWYNITTSTWVCCNQKKLSPYPVQLFM